MTLVVVAKQLRTSKTTSLAIKTTHCDEPLNYKPDDVTQRTAWHTVDTRLLPYLRPIERL